MSNKPSPMDTAHVMDLGALHLGHRQSSKRALALVDLDIQVYGLDEIQGGTLPITVIILSHAWASSAKRLEPMAHGMLGEMRRLEAESGPRTRDVLVVTLDLRSHGNRRRPDGMNFNNNPRSMIELATFISGSRHDNQLVMDALPWYLFPKDERQIVEWIPVGISMGGHVAWRLIREEPRVRIGVPIITVPNECLSSVFLQNWGRMGWQTWFPAPLKVFMDTRPPMSTYADKKILSVHGELDALMVYKMGEARLREIQAGTRPGDVDVYVQDGFGHVVTPEMMRRAAEWVWRWGVGPDALPVASWCVDGVE